MEEILYRINLFSLLSGLVFSLTTFYFITRAYSRVKQYGNKFSWFFAMVMVFLFPIAICGLTAWFAFVGPVFSLDRMIIFTIVSLSIGGVGLLLMLASSLFTVVVLSISEEQRSIFASSPIGIFLVDRNGHVMSANNSAIFLESQGTDQFIGSDIFSMRLYADIGLMKYLRGGLAGEGFDVDLQVHAPNASDVLWRHYVGRPVFGYETKKVDRLVVMVEDITERKLLELELKSLNAELEERVQDRTKQVEEKLAEIVAAEERLRKRSRAMINILEDMRSKEQYFEKLNQVLVGREVRMLELKEQIKQMTAKANS